MLCKDGGLNEKLGVYIHKGMETIQFTHYVFVLLTSYIEYLKMSKLNGTFQIQLHGSCQIIP